MTNMAKHKVFISHYHADDDEVKKFIDYFCEEKDIFTPKVVGDDYDTTINSNDSDYIMRRIREDYLADSTVTIVLIGKETAKRKYVDWEIASTIRNDKNNKRSGLIGIYLDGKSDSNIPSRLQDNINTGYANVYSYPLYNPSTLERWIDDAYERRNDDSYVVDNTRPLFQRNR